MPGIIRVTGPLAQLIERDSREAAIDVAHLVGVDYELEAMIERCEPSQEQHEEPYKIKVPPRSAGRDPHPNRPW